jgi:hypothetical protein
LEQSEIKIAAGYEWTFAGSGECPDRGYDSEAKKELSDMNLHLTDARKSYGQD